MQLIVFIEFIVFILAMAWTNPSHGAEDWQAFTPAEANISLALDKASITRQGTTVKFWERVEFVQPEQQDEVSGRMIKFKRIHRLMDCSARTQGVLRGSLFAENGKLIEASITEPASVQMSAIPTGTLAEQEFDLVCAKTPVAARPAGTIPPIAPVSPAIPAENAPTVDLRGAPPPRQP
jgi:hypothetical protein